MKRPLPVVIISLLAMLNGVVTFTLGLVTLLGSRVLFTPSGYGPNRVAISQLFGPLAGQAGWIVLALGALFVLVGHGLFTLRRWARLAVVWVFALVAGATLVAAGWGVYHGEVGVAISGLLKAGAEAGLCLYLASRGVRGAFSR
jgi:hypothetical protein